MEVFHLKNSKKLVLFLTLTMAFALVLCGAASAANTPLNTTQNGTVSGDLYVNATQPVAWVDQPSSGVTSREFNQTYNLPTYTDIEWAQVYVNIYSGTGSANWPAQATILLDGDGNGTYETILGNELLTSAQYSIDGTQYWINDHCFRVYSDYQLWYDVTGLITCNNPSVYVKTEQVGTETFDGRLKMITLVAAYNDGDNDKVNYWVNDGQDWIASGTSQTTFATSTITADITNATLNTVALSSKDGSYTFNGETHNGTDPVAPINYFETHTWDVTSNITPGADSTLVYTVGSGSFKNVLATLTVRELTPPTANFTSDTTSGTRPLAVQFISTSSGIINSYAWDFDNNGTIDSADPNPTWTYTSAGTYTVNLTVTGPGGSDSETKTDFITVNGKTWYVDDDGGPGIDFTDIQSAVNSSSSYDTIVVKAGTYTGFNVNKPYLTILGEGAELVTVAPNSQGQYGDIRISDSSGDATGTVLEGMTLTSTLKLGYFGPAGNCVVKNCIINTENGLDFGRYYPGSNLTFEGNTFMGSGNLGFYGASSKIINNYFGSSVSVYLNTGSDNSTLNNNIIENSTNNYAVAVLSPHCTISNNIFKNNTQTALILSAAGQTVTRNLFTGNGFAIKLTSKSNESNIYLNSFINNTIQITYQGSRPTTINWSSPELIPYTYNNTTYTGYMGNHWSEYIDDDSDGDGIGNTPHTIPNSLGTDNYPLIAPWDQYFDIEAPFVSASPAGGVLTAATQVTLTATDNMDPNPQIYYTTNGKTPNITSTLYMGPISIGQTTTLKFIAIDNSGNMSAVQTEIYTDNQAPTITASPTGGVLTSATQITLTATDNMDPNPRIYYTTDGTDPTSNSTWYTHPINITKTTTLKFIAVDNSGNMSAVQTEIYTDNQAPTITASPTGGVLNTATQITLTATDNMDPNPRIYYTTDGTDPTSSSTLYTGPVNLTHTTTLKFIAVDTDGNMSAVGNETYTDVQTPTVTVNPVGGTYTSKTQVVLSAMDNADPDPAIYYTINGVDPTISSTLYTGPFYIPATFTLKFIAVDGSGNTSPVQIETYTMVDVEAPTVSASQSGYKVTLSATDNVDPNPRIYYTLDGTDPTTGSTWYTGTLSLPVNTTTLKFIAVDAMGNTSPVQTETYTITDTQVPVVNATRDGNTIVLTATDDLDPNPIIYYTTDGTDPTTSSTPYSAPINLPANATTTIRFIAVDAGGNTSMIKKRTYVTSGSGYRNEGGRFSDGQDKLNTSLYFEGNIGVRILEYGGYSWFDSVDPNIATFTASALNIPEGATVLAARLFQAWTWYGDPYYTIQFNGHESQQHVAKYLDWYSGVYIFDVTPYFNETGDNVAVITDGRANYGTMLVVVYEAASEPYRQIWVNEGQDCLMYGSEDPYIAYTMFDNVNTTKLASAKITSVHLSGDGWDGHSIKFNDQPFEQAGVGGSDPSIHYYDVTSALQDGTNELGIKDGDSYFSIPIVVMEVTKDIIAPMVSADPEGGVFSTSQNVTLTVTDDLDTSPDIYYTTNGEYPTTTSTLYTEPITVDTTTTLMFIAVDDAGNVSSIQNETYTISTGVPTVNADLSTRSYNTPQTVHLTAADAVDPAPVIYYRINNGAWNSQTTPVAINLPEGTTILEFYAQNASGNQSTHQYMYYTIDTIAPTVTADIPGGSYNTPQTVHLTATDAMDSSPLIYYQINDGKWTHQTAPVTINLTAGTTKLEFYAKDDLHNHSDRQTITYTINAQPQIPQVTIDQLLEASETIKTYYETHGQLPTSVTINSTQMTMSQILYMLAAATLNISNNNLTPVKVKTVISPTNPSGSYKTGNLYKASYLTTAQNIQNFINTNNRAPNYAQTSLGKIPFSKLVYMYSKIINFYKTNKRLPNYVAI